MNQLFLAVLNMSIAAVLLFVLVLAGRLALRRYGTAGFRYLLWLPFLLRLLVPYSLPSVFSVYNLFHQNVSRPGGMLLSVVYLEPAFAQEQVLSTGQQLRQKQLFMAACVVWAAVAGILLLAFAVQYLRLRGALAVAYRAPDEQTQPLAKLAGLRRVPAVLYTPAVRGPMAFGILHPRVLLPMQLKEQPEVRRYILLHEFSHIRWADHLLLAVSWLALALHWFNPLVWLARSLMARDIEGACDQRVLRLVGSEEQLAYAQALVDWADKRRLSMSYAAFGEQDVVRRVKGVLGWRRLPRWAEVLLGCAVVGVFLCTATNPVLPESTYLPQTSPFVSEGQRELFRQTAYQLQTALETGDPALLAQLASMDPAYYAPLYQSLDDLSLRVDSMRLYCNDATSAEVYLQVTVDQGAGLYAAGKGTLVAHFSQTDYRAEPFVDCLMPQQKYEGARLADTDSEAAKLAVRLCANLDQPTFEAATLSPVTVARVCMGSALEDKGESAPFTPARMAELAKEYFALDNFSCTDPAVYDAATNTYFYSQTPQPQMVVTRMEKTGDQMQVTVESFDDPLCLYPLQRLECQLQEAG